MMLDTTKRIQALHIPVCAGTARYDDFIVPDRGSRPKSWLVSSNHSNNTMLWGGVAECRKVRQSQYNDGIIPITYPLASSHNQGQTRILQVIDLPEFSRALEKWAKFEKF